MVSFVIYNDNYNNIFKMSFWKTTAIYGIGFLCLRAISFLLLPLYTNLLSQHDVGWIFIIYTLLAFLNVLYIHGMNASLFKFFHSYNHKEVITSSILYSIIYGLCLSACLFIAYCCYIKISNNSSQHMLVAIILSIAFLDMISSRNSIVLRLLERPYYYLFVCFMNVISSLAFNIYFIQFCDLGLLGAINALICVSLMQFMLLSPVMLSFCRIKFFNISLLGQMLRFGIAFFPAALFLVLIEMSDRWMLGYLRNINDVGLYGAGYKIGSIILLLVNSFNLNWQPYYLKLGIKRGVATFENIGEHFILILLSLSTLLSILWPIVFQLNIGPYHIIGSSFWEGGHIVPIICVSYIFYGLFILQMPSIYLKEKQSWAPFFWGLGFVVNFISNCILIPSFGIYGAAYATLLAYCTMSVLLVYKNRVWLPIKYPIKKITVFGLCSFLSYVFSQFIYQSNSLQYIYLLVFVYSFFALWYIYNTSKRLLPELY